MAAPARELNMQVLYKAATDVATGSKSPVSALNELGVPINYEMLTRLGPAHNPRFSMVVTIAGMSFNGCGSNKREAKTAAARNCLQALVDGAASFPPASAPTPSSALTFCPAPTAASFAFPPASAPTTPSALTFRPAPSAASFALPPASAPTTPSALTFRPAPSAPSFALPPASAPTTPSALTFRPAPSAASFALPPASAPTTPSALTFRPAPSAASFALPPASAPTTPSALTFRPAPSAPSFALPPASAPTTPSALTFRPAPSAPSFALPPASAPTTPSALTFRPAPSAASFALPPASAPTPPSALNFRPAPPPLASSSLHYFTSDEPLNESGFLSEIEVSMKQENEETPMDVDTVGDAYVQAQLQGPSTSSVALISAPLSSPKNPISVVYEQFPGVSFAYTFGDGTPIESPQAPEYLSPNIRFRACCTINEKTFEGFGATKKQAKLAAAKAVLLLTTTYGSSLPLEPNIVVAPTELPPNQPMLPQWLAEHVARLVNIKFAQMMREDSTYAKRMVLAGIVLTVDNKTESAKVIAVTTGSKCVSGDHISPCGLALNDCHAEIVARRCLQRYLYSQLLAYAKSSDPKKPIPDSDLEPIPSGGYQLKLNRQLHLYVSTSPCGDGRIFSLNDNYLVETDKHPNKLARGQLRTKIECGEGTVPVKNSCNAVQTWDGLAEGNRLQTMSCSDKVARWCVVGLQGALLGCLIKPVYLHSLVLGSQLHPQHLYRALCGRIENHLAALPPPFRLQPPLLGQSISAEVRVATKGPKFSVCWTSPSPVPEIVNACTGKLANDFSSLLCKQAMFLRWQHLITRLPLLPQETEPGVSTELSNLSYYEAKQLCTSYQIANKCLMDAFKNAGLGQWIKKPIEQDQFVCNVNVINAEALF